MNKIIHFLRYTNFFNRPTIIRKLQCDIWGIMEDVFLLQQKMEKSGVRGAGEIC